MIPKKIQSYKVYNRAKFIPLRVYKKQSAYLHQLATLQSYQCYLILTPFHEEGTLVPFSYSRTKGCIFGHSHGCYDPQNIGRNESLLFRLSFGGSWHPWLLLKIWPQSRLRVQAEASPLHSACGSAGLKL